MRAIFCLDTDPFSTFPSLEQCPERILRGRGWIAVGGERIKLPHRRCDVGQAIVDGNIKTWIDVLHSMRRNIDPSSLCLVAFGDPLRELFQLGARLGFFSYGVYFAESPSRIFARDYDFIGSADILTFMSCDVETAFRSAYVLHYKSASIESLSLQAPLLESHSETGTIDQNVINVLIVGYYSGPSRTVGVKRINYWRETLGDIADGNLRVTVATATKWDVQHDDVHVVPDWGPSVLIEEDGTVPRWAGPFIKYERQNAQSFSTQSYYWRIALEKHFEKCDQKFDVVIITGNPFAVFDFGAFAKRTWYAKVILDYRDPFANNPRMAFSPAARARARYVERGYNLAADVVTVVNSDCIPMVEAKEDVQVAVVSNGYDERAMPQAKTPRRKSDKKIHFVHAGSIFHDRSPKSLINSMNADIHCLHHIGSLNGIDPDDQQAEHLFLHGTMEYSDVLSEISSADCGIVFVSESGFETPTKLYDYLAYDLDILIITHGAIEQGAVADTLQDLPGVYWAKNSEESIAEFLRTYRPTDARRPEAAIHRFSRRASAEKLVAIIQNLVGTRSFCDQPISPNSSALA